MKIMRNIEWDKYDEFLGKISDADIARKIGCSPRTIHNRRVELNIEPFVQIKKKITYGKNK
jgi:hypothetical protein